MGNNLLSVEHYTRSAPLWYSPNGRDLLAGRQRAGQYGLTVTFRPARNAMSGLLANVEQSHCTVVEAQETQVSAHGFVVHTRYTGGASRHYICLPLRRSKIPDLQTLPRANPDPEF